LAVTNVLVQVPAENLKYKFLYRYMSCPQTFAKILTDQRELCERGCTGTTSLELPPPVRSGFFCPFSKVGNS